MTLMLAGPIRMRRPGREARRRYFRGVVVGRCSYPAKPSTEGGTWDGRGSAGKWLEQRVLFSDKNVNVGIEGRRMNRRQSPGVCECSCVDPYDLIRRSALRELDLLNRWRFRF